MMLVAQQTTVLRHVEDTAACNRWVEERLSEMTLKQKVGQLIIHTVAPVVSQRNKENIRAAVKEYAIGGLLFSGGNLDKQVQLTNWAQEIADVPLMITFDGEWGLAMRLKGTPSFPKNRVIGCIQNDTLIYRYGREVARQLREIGVQVNFAPVADIDNNPLNPVINIRSFGSDTKAVARKVIAYSRGLEDGGVLAVCKHFPGHGDTEVDSHRALPNLKFDKARLDSVELYPFREAIQSGIGGVMVGHLHVPELGKLPASISEDIVVNTLQRELKFSGLTFTDALEMKGISGTQDVCAQALIAGNDVLLAPRNLKRELAGILKAVKEGRLSEEIITEKCRKVLTYKYALGLYKRTSVQSVGLRQRLNTPSTQELIAEMKQSAVTVLKDSIGMLPLDLSLSSTMLLSVAPSLADASPFYKALHESVSLTWIKGEAYPLPVLREKLRSAQQVIVALHQRDCKQYVQLLEEQAVDKPLILVCFDTQKTLQQMEAVLPKAAAVVLAHSDETEVQQYVARVLTGKANADGRLSVRVGGFMAGTGVTVDPEHPYAYCPEDFGMDSAVLAEIDSIAQEGIREKAFPGCHVLVLKKGYPVYNKCFGSFSYDGDAEPVKENSIYDLASLSKVTGTLLAVMKLYDEGKFGLTDPVSRYLPLLKGTDKERITVEDLLFHQSGLPAYLPFYVEAIDLKSCKGGLFRKKKDKNHQLRVETNLYACTNFSYKEKWVSRHQGGLYSLPLSDSLHLNPLFRDEILRQIVEIPLKGHSYRYSCLNFMLLKEMVETIAHCPLDEYLDSVFYRPMGLLHTSYRPLHRFPKEQIVPTVKYDFLRKGEVRGYVHDEAAAFMGGVSGNAGLFSTAHDVGVIFQLLLDKGVCGDRRYLTRATCELFTTMKAKNSRRGLGFDKPDREDAAKGSCAEGIPVSVFGHTGFTGTCAWADPDNDLVFVFLSNRVWPQVYGNNKLNRLHIRTRMQEVMYRSMVEKDKKLINLD